MDPALQDYLAALQDSLDKLHRETMARTDNILKQLQDREAQFSKLDAAVSAPQLARPTVAASDGGLAVDATVTAVLPDVSSSTTDIADNDAGVSEAPLISCPTESVPLDVCSTPSLQTVALSQSDAPMHVRRSTEYLVHDDDWVQPMLALSYFSLTCAPPNAIYPAGHLLHLTPTERPGHGIHLAVESMDLLLPPLRKEIEQQPWPPPTQVQIAENDDGQLHGIAHSCVTGDSGNVWWPPDYQPRIRSKLQELLHPTPLQVFLVSSAEQQPWPSGQLTFLISTELSDCCDEMIPTRAHAGTKRMEFSTQSDFPSSSEQFQWEVAWPLSFERKTTASRPCFMHTFQFPFREIQALLYTWPPWKFQLLVLPGIVFPGKVISDSEAVLKSTFTLHSCLPDGLCDATHPLPAYKTLQWFGDSYHFPDCISTSALDGHMVVWCSDFVDLSSQCVSAAIPSLVDYLDDGHLAAYLNSCAVGASWNDSHGHSFVQFEKLWAPGIEGEVFGQRCTFRRR